MRLQLQDRRRVGSEPGGWCSYMGTIGMEQIDHFVSDAQHIPPEYDRFRPYGPSTPYYPIRPPYCRLTLPK